MSPEQELGIWSQKRQDFLDKKGSLKTQSGNNLFRSLLNENRRTIKNSPIDLSFFYDKIVLCIK